MAEMDTKPGNEALGPRPSNRSTYSPRDTPFCVFHSFRASIQPLHDCSDIYMPNRSTDISNSSARHENRPNDSMQDQIGSDSQIPSGVQTPQPDLSDKRLPGIMHSYFGQVGSPSSNSSSPQKAPALKTPFADTGVENYPTERDRNNPRRSSSASSGSMVMVEKHQTNTMTPPMQPGDPEPILVHKPNGTDESRLPPTPVSATSSLLQRESVNARNGKNFFGGGISSVTQALRNLVLPPSSTSVKARRHQSLPVSSTNTKSVSAAHISNPSTSVHIPRPESPNVPDPSSPDKHRVPVSTDKESTLTSNAASVSREKSTPPLSPRALSYEGRPEKRSPLSSSSSTKHEVKSEPDEKSEVKSEGLPTGTARGKLAVKIAEARNIRPCYDPYVVCVFEWNEYISEGPKHDAMDVDGDEKPRHRETLSSQPMRRTESDMGKPVAIPMRSRQSSRNGLSETHEDRPSMKINDPQWDHEAMLYVDPELTFPSCGRSQNNSDVLGHQSEIDISVYDARDHDAFLGHVRLCLNLSEANPVLEGWFPLEPRANKEEEKISGELHVKMHFTKTDKRHFGPNDFQILKLIGKGTFGQVYQVRKKDTQRIYAMKVLSKKVIIQKKEVAHTLGERNILVRTAMADSPFIVGLKFSFQTPTDLYLVTDFMSGGELFWHLQKEGRFKEDRAKFYIAELILALQHLHQHDIVYRDLKPENILLDANGHIALCDFGLSKANLTKNDTTNTFCGTTEYLAPEVLLDEQGYTKMVDFWSLGVLVFEMCCGWSPFYAEDTQQMYKNIAFGKVRFPRDALSAEGRNFVKGLLNRNPKHRLGANRDAQELIEHPFFADVDWKALAQKNLVPPFKPKLSSVGDTSNFDPEFTNALNTSSSLNARAAALANGTATASTPLSPTMQNAFRGFTFVDESTLEGQYNHQIKHEEEDTDDDNQLQPSQTREHRMSGVQRTGTEDGIFNEDNWDM